MGKKKSLLSSQALQNSEEGGEKQKVALLLKVYTAMPRQHICYVSLKQSLFFLMLFISNSNYKGYSFWLPLREAKHFIGMESKVPSI